MEFIITHKVEILGFLFALSELLALTGLKSNSVFQLIYNSLKEVTGK